MKKVLVVYATREGQTRRIAEHVAATLRARDLPTEVVEAAHLPADFGLGNYAAAILAGSVHLGHHEKELVRFVQAHRPGLELLPTAFLSVSLSEAGVERPFSTPEVRAKSEAGVKQTIDAFFAETGWHPALVRPVAGALLYREYGVLKRLVLKIISRQAGGNTDTSRDYEYTDWGALDRFVAEVAERIAAPGTAAGERAPIAAREQA